MFSRDMTTNARLNLKSWFMNYIIILRTPKFKYQHGICKIPSLGPVHTLFNQDPIFNSPSLPVGPFLSDYLTDILSVGTCYPASILDVTYSDSILRTVQIMNHHILLLSIVLLIPASMKTESSRSGRLLCWSRNRTSSYETRESITVQERTLHCTLA